MTGNDQGNAAVAYFPRCETSYTSNILTQPLPQRPTEVGQIYDTAHWKEPLVVFDQKVHHQNFLGPSETGESIAPSPPDDFQDRYLFPYLTQNERLRLTLLWYHTRLIERDDHVLAKIDALVKSAQNAIGWEYAIAGIVSESTYTRLAATNLPIDILPRRESTCSHTINQTSGSVFMVTDMSTDWRFRNSPHVEFGGLKSYAGTQLRLRTGDGGDDVSLGSLCVASSSPQPPLSQDQRDFLVRLAEVISLMIESYTRRRRLKDRREMSDWLTTLQHSADVEDHEDIAVRLIQRVYPDAQVSIQLPIDGTISVQGRPSIPISDVQDGLWEDTAFIDHVIRTANFETFKSEQTTRTIVARCGSINKFVVVASRDIHHVFDDYDSWFISRSASVIADTIQSRLLRQALEAREAFLRGITHQLRTPIHGVLGSVELLAEDLAARHLLGTTPAHGDLNKVSTSPSACIATIRTSGQELITTVNNILKHNNWADSLRRYRPTQYDLRNLEGDILPEVLSLLPPEHLRGVAIEFRLELVDGHFILATDAQLLKDCVQAIVLNATQAVFGASSGTVTVIVRRSSDFTQITFDVVDNGCGIGVADQERIFSPYEKVDSNKPGAGLGLTLASKIAPVLNGSIKLVSSDLGTGSHFQIELKDQAVSNPADPSPTPSIPLEHLPRTFTVVRGGTRFNHFIDHTTRYLEKNGFHHSDASDTRVIVTNLEIEELSSQLRHAHAEAVVIRHSVPEKPEEVVDGSPIITVLGPLHTRKLDQTLQHADHLYKDLSRKTIQHQVEGNCSWEAIVDDSKSPLITRIAQLALTGDLDITQPASNRRLKALLVDDNPINLRILQMFCQKRKIPYVTADNGHRAFQRFKTAAESGEPVTLVLMDLQMPHCDGVQATATIRAYESEHAVGRSTIFMVTGQGSEKDQVDSKTAGSDEFLVKPVGPLVLDRHIASYFSLYRPG